MWISALAIAIALALFAQVAAFFLLEYPRRAWGEAPGRTTERGRGNL